MIDWNDFGIDPRPLLGRGPRTPRDWFTSYGFHVDEAEDGSDFEQVTQALFAMIGHAADGKPRMSFGPHPQGPRLPHV